jgi:hypothetical protein
MFHVFCLVAAAMAADSTSAAKNSAPEEPRPLHAIQAEISDLLKREANSRSPAVRAEIVRRMCALHGEIVRDSRFATSDTLAEYRVRLWSRLKRAEGDLKRELARTARAGNRSNADQPVPADPDSQAVAESLASSLSLLDQSQGGPGYLLGFGGRAVPPDHGQELVELIEQTINPAFWDTNGGPGTIVYYAPLKCIVVRATSEVHGNIGGLVGGLRKAGN